MQARIVIGVALIVGLVGWLAWTGFEEGRAYYHTCDELAAQGASAVGAPLRLAGHVVEGSIEREGTILLFTLAYNGQSYPVRYDGDDPVPDTFKDGVEAVVDGELGSDGIFHGRKIQAKCASKYEAEYGEPETPGRTA